MLWFLGGLGSLPWASAPVDTEVQASTAARQHCVPLRKLDLIVLMRVSWLFFSSPRVSGPAPRWLEVPSTPVSRRRAPDCTQVQPESHRQHTRTRFPDERLRTKRTANGRG